MTRTSLIFRPLLEFLFPAASEETLQIYHGLIRKLAHFIEYATLALLACRAFTGSLQNFVRKHRHILAIVLVVLVAVIDEANQSFNPARTGSAFDVLINLSGGLTATLSYYFLSKRRSHRRAGSADLI